jgi:hypothetical protein
LQPISNFLETLIFWTTNFNPITQGKQIKVVEGHSCNQCANKVVEQQNGIIYEPLGN